MTRRKIRPEHGASVTPDMSLRDVACALGVSTSELGRWRALAALPNDVFERRLKIAQSAYTSTGRLVTAESVLRAEEPVPARGRVERWKSLWRGMSEQERCRARAWLLKAGGAA